MLIEKVCDKDINDLLHIAKKAVCETVDASDEDKPNILKGINSNIKNWYQKHTESVFLKYIENQNIVGYLLIKEYWNFSDIFILPEYQRQGIGRKLAETAIDICRLKSSKTSIRVNSSRNAVRFYKSLGFKEIQLTEKLPYEMTALEYYL